MERRQYLRLGALGTGASLVGRTTLLEAAEEREERVVTTRTERVDDWQYDPDEHGGHSVSVGNASGNGTNATYSSSVQLQSTTTSADVSAIGDDALRRELDLMDRVLTAGD